MIKIITVNMEALCKHLIALSFAVEDRHEFCPGLWLENFGLTVMVWMHLG